MKQIIFSDNAPSPIGHYSQAVKHGQMLYISGQLAIDPATNKLVSGSVSSETRRVMDNIKAILEAAGMTFENVVYATVLLRDINDFEKVNKSVFGVFQPGNGSGTCRISGSMPAQERFHRNNDGGGRVIRKVRFSYARKELRH